MTRETAQKVALWGMTGAMFVALIGGILCLMECGNGPTQVLPAPNEHSLLVLPIESQEKQ